MTRNQLTFALTSVACVAAGFFGHRALATVPVTADALNYTGRITDSAGPLNGNRTMQVLGYASQNAPTAACSTMRGNTVLTNGYFRISMDNCRAELASNAGLWVEVLIDDVPVAPRTRVGAVPYALEAVHADTATTTAAVAGWQSLPIELRRGEDGSLVTDQTTVGMFRRVGDSLEFQIRTTFTATPALGSTGYYYPLPAGVVLAADKLPAGAVESLVGTAILRNGTTNVTGGVMAVASPAKLHVYQNGGGILRNPSAGVGTEGTVFLSGFIPVQ